MKKVHFLQTKKEEQGKKNEFLFITQMRDGGSINQRIQFVEIK